MPSISWPQFGAVPRLRRELGKFGLVGGCNLAIDVAAYNVLLRSLLEHETLTAKTISTTLAAVSSYFMNRHWTWRDRESHGLRRELPIFLLLSAVGLGIADLCLGISHYGLHFTSKLDDNISSYVVALPLGMLWRFWSFRRWVFTDPGRSELTPLEASLGTLD